MFAWLPREKAAIGSLLGALMLLPANFQVDIALLPPIEKMGIAAFATVLLCWMNGAPVPQPRRSYLMYACAAVFILSPILTSLGNSYELQKAGKSVPGFYPIDGLKFAGRNLLTLIPLYIGSRFISSNDARALLLKAIAIAMLIYSLPMLFEIRMSPQIHRWTYGYFPHSFAQQMRDGGFRPVVFVGHGLAVALLTSLAVIASFILLRMKARIARLPASAAATYLSGLLVLCKSLGPTIYALLLAPLVLFTRPRLWVKFGCAVSLFACAYPLLRTEGLTPIELVSSAAQVISPERSASFAMRVGNEDQLLAKAEEKPAFGWGGWGRNRIFDQWTGRDVSVTDGGWIIQFGTFGWVGYLALYGLLALAQFRALRSTGRELTPANITRGGLSLLLTVCIADSIPNAMQLPLMFLIAGAIAGSPVVHRSLAARRMQTVTGQRAAPLAASH